MLFSIARLSGPRLRPIFRRRECAVSDAWLLVDPVSGVVCVFGEYDITSDRYSVREGDVIP